MVKTSEIDQKIQSVAQECVEQIICKFDLELGEFSQQEIESKAEELGWAIAEEIQGWFGFSPEPDLECDQEEQNLERLLQGTLIDPNTGSLLVYPEGGITDAT